MHKGALPIVFDVNRMQIPGKPGMKALLIRLLILLTLSAFRLFFFFFPPSPFFSHHQIASWLMVTLVLQRAFFA